MQAESRTGRLRALLDEHRQFAMLLALFVMFRVMAAVFLLPGGYVTGGGPDDYYYLNFSALSSAGYYPYFGYWSDYPPVFPLLATAVYRLSLSLPAGDTYLMVFHAFLHWSYVPFETANLVLLYAIALRLFDRREAEWIATAYIASFVPLFVFLGWFDAIGLTFLLLAIWGMLAQRPLAGGAGVGFGFLAKIFPAIVVPAALMALAGRKRRILFGITAVTIIAVVIGGLFIASPDYTLASFRARLSGAVPYETVYALLDKQMSFGAVAPLDARVDPASALTGYESHLPTLWITLAFAVLGLFLWTRPIEWQNPQRSVAFVGLTWSMFLLYSQTFSPQWHLLTVALLLLAIRGWRGVVWTLLLTVLLVWEWPIAYGVFLRAPWVAAILIILRTLATIALALDFAARVFPDTARLERISRLALPVALQITLVAALALASPMTRAYRQIRATEGRLAPAIEAIRADSADSTVITAEFELFVQLAPSLNGQAHTLLAPQVYDSAWQPLDAWLANETRGADSVWLVTTDANNLYTPAGVNANLAAWLEENLCPPETAPTSPGILTLRYAAPDDSGNCPAPGE